ncbi:MAG TPA: hypothetical protein VGZ93_01405 [Candidatus Methylacidiphilales bacterium]|jgi:hypothetical protein|nr:hypothetical protein [Candidatus Methylacidiphilales bacterium]
MKHRLLGCIVWGIFLGQGGFAMAQSSIQALESEFNEANVAHQQATSKMLTDFFAQIDVAMASPEAAIALYQQAGGALPDPTPVVTAHSQETATEREKRVAQDQANLAKLGVVVQLHCGLMHYAALFVVSPDQKGLQNEWVAWLRTTAQIYPQLSVAEASNAPKQEGAPNDDNAPSNAPGQNRHNGRRDRAPRPQPAFNPEEMKDKTMRDSIISKFLAFNAWGDKEQGGWSVGDLPKLYRANVLEPLRTPPTPATLTAWDGYIAMANADEPDNDKWNQIDYPPLAFDRACDDYAIAPNAEKLEGLVTFIKTNPANPNADDWIASVRKLLDDYRASHGGPRPAAQNPSPFPSAPSGNPNVSVTTEQQGDAMIIITHTNSAPVTNAPPQPTP